MGIGSCPWGKGYCHGATSATRSQHSPCMFPITRIPYSVYCIHSFTHLHNHHSLTQSLSGLAYATLIRFCSPPSSASKLSTSFVWTLANRASVYLLYLQPLLPAISIGYIRLAQLYSSMFAFTPPVWINLLKLTSYLCVWFLTHLWCGFCFFYKNW